jgi:DNA-binding CsgD family transcriptional regulator
MTGPQLARGNRKQAIAFLDESLAIGQSMVEAALLALGIAATL